MPSTLLQIHASRAGMGDSCCSMGSIGSIARLLEDELGVFVYSIATGEGEYQDIWSSFYGRKTACTLTMLARGCLLGDNLHRERCRHESRPFC